MRACSLQQRRAAAPASGARCFVPSVRPPVGVRPVRSLLHPTQQASVQHATALVAQAVASQAGTPPPRAGKKKVKKMVDITGEVLKDLSNGMFQVKLENGVSVIAHLSGKIRQNRIKVVVGDKVTVELSPYDLTKGRITLRHKPGQDPTASASGSGSGSGAP